MTDPGKPPALKLAKLPDRKPVKMTITLSVEQAKMLRAYAAANSEAYGEAEDAVALVPFILDAIIGADRVFKRSAQLDPAETPARNKARSRAA